MADEISKEEFDVEVESYKGTPLYKKKHQTYKNGFKDALFLAWQIVDEYKREVD